MCSSMRPINLVAVLLLSSWLLLSCTPGPIEEPDLSPPAETEAVATEEMATEVVEVVVTVEPFLGTEANPVIWVLVPSQDTEAVLAGAEEIAAAIEEQTGLIVEPLISTDYTGAVEAMCNGEAHMGALNTFNYILANARGCAEVSLVSVRFGSTFYNGQVVARSDSGIDSVSALAGATFCRPDPTSTSGWVIPSIAMRAEGIDPEIDLAEIVDAGGHDGVIIAVYNGDCQAGSTFVDARSNVEADFPDVNDVVLVITESPPIPNDNISFHPSMERDTKDALVRVFIELASTEQGLEILNTVYSWDGMDVVDDSFYDGFRQQLEAAGLTICELVVCQQEVGPEIETGILLPPGWTLPGNLNPANIIPPPTGDDLERAKSSLEAAMQEYGISIEEFNTDLVSFDDGEISYVAPTKAIYDRFEYGVVLAVFWDRQDNLGAGAVVYQLLSGDDDQSIALIHPDGSAQVLDAIFSDQPTVAPRTTAFYVSGSHWVCVPFDSRAICAKLPW